MNDIQKQIIKFLDNKGYININYIAKYLNISKNNIINNIKTLKNDYKIILFSKSKLNYMLQEKLDLIKVNNLFKFFKNINYFYSIDSTSKYALNNKNNFYENTIFISEFQTDGFGRFNRKWISPFGQNIYCTLLEIIELSVFKLNGLSLVIAMNIARILKDFSLNAQLKWPNDIIVNNKKIAGVIIDISLDINNKVKLFIGFGINVNMQYNKEISNNWTSIKLECKKHYNRTNLLIHIIKDIKKDLIIFFKNGFSYFIEEFEKFNYLKNKIFSLQSSNKNFFNCEYLGLSNLGEIIVKSQQGIHLFSSGDISVLDNSIKFK